MKIHNNSKLTISYELQMGYSYSLDDDDKYKYELNAGDKFKGKSGIFLNLSV